MVRRSVAASWVEVADAMYAPAPSEREWLAGVLDAIHELLPRTLMLHAMRYDASDPSAMKLSTIVTRHTPGVPHEIAEAGIRASQAALPAADVKRSFWSLRAATASELLGTAAGRKLRLDEVASPFGIADSLGINAVDPDHRGVAIIASLPERTRLHTDRRDVLLRAAVHLATAIRLRDARGTRAAAPVRPEEGAAVLDAKLRLAHATGAAKGRREREALLECARAIVAERRTRPLDDARALAAWRALVEGRWSLVASSDVDGKRFFVAVENGVPAGGDVEALTPRERQVAALVGIGHANKLVAYELGISTGSVARAVSGAMRKLGLRSRTELVELVSALGPPEASR